MYTTEKDENMKSPRQLGKRNDEKANRKIRNL